MLECCMEFCTFSTIHIAFLKEYYSVVDYTLITYTPIFQPILLYFKLYSYISTYNPIFQLIIPYFNLQSHISTLYSHISTYNPIFQLIIPYFNTTQMVHSMRSFKKFSNYPLAVQTGLCKKGWYAR